MDICPYQMFHSCHDEQNLCEHLRTCTVLALAYILSQGGLGCMSYHFQAEKGTFGICRGMPLVQLQLSLRAYRMLLSISQAYLHPCLYPSLRPFIQKQWLTMRCRPLCLKQSVFGLTGRAGILTYGGVGRTKQSRDNSTITNPNARWYPRGSNLHDQMTIKAIVVNAEKQSNWG